jgi:hypothetical protein
MSNRSLNWSAAVRGLNADRAAILPGLAGARAMAQCYSRSRKLPLVVAGQFDRKAIMTCAALAAKDHQRKFGCTWGEALSVALKATWQAARVARSALAH